MFRRTYFVPNGLAISRQATQASRSGDHLDPSFDTNSRIEVASDFTRGIAGAASNI